jgi:hypothetical protein
MPPINMGDGGSATSTAGAATINHNSGVITTEALTTAHGAEYSMVVTNNNLTATSAVVASVQNGTNTTNPVAISSITPAAGSVTIKVVNLHASAALNGTLIISFAHV